MPERIVVPRAKLYEEVWAEPVTKVAARYGISDVAVAKACRRVHRTKLYEEIWAQPVTKVAARYGVTDVALAKACRRLDIPLPQRGYWSKIAAGQPPNRPPLPPRKRGETEEYQIQGSSLPRPSDANVAGGPQSRWQQAAVPNVVVMVDASLRDPHPMVRRVAKQLERKDVYISNGLRRAHDPFEVEVGPASVNRALRIVDALLKALQRAGCQFRPWAGYGQDGHVVVDGEPIVFRLRERLRRVQHKRTEEDESRFSVPEFDLEPAGELQFKLRWRERYFSETEWKDAKGQRLEDLVGHIFAGFFQSAANWKTFRAEKEADAERKRLLQQKEWQRQQAAKEEQERVEVLRTAAKLWEEAALVRAYVSELERRATGVALEKVYDRPVADWAVWARTVADQLDPLRRIAEMEAKPRDSTLSR